LDFISSAASFADNDIVKYDTAWGSGGDAVSKAPLDMPVEYANNIGTVERVIDPNSMWAEGGIVSRALNYVPGVNAVAGMHDVFQVRLDEWGGERARNLLNVLGMLPAAAITYGALINNIAPLSNALTVNRAR